MWHWHYVEGWMSLSQAGLNVEDYIKLLRYWWAECILIMIEDVGICTDFIYRLVIVWKERRRWASSVPTLFPASYFTTKYDNKWWDPLFDLHLARFRLPCCWWHFSMQICLNHICFLCATYIYLGYFYIYIFEMISYVFNIIMKCLIPGALSSSSY